MTVLETKKKVESICPRCKKKHMADTRWRYCYECHRVVKELTEPIGDSVPTSWWYETEEIPTNEYYLLIPNDLAKDNKKIKMSKNKK